ncbi:hypothetical protein [Acidiphilium multivorum]|uniref:hypothetical protein n=1 Tax=Acidiphilium multivorum TaxID=62140 RepID=UPI001B8B3611|nr:hypothetical protein [Acidiphilium multivorum]MBS3025278.1 hypothetical protein [Acidiphilium multivorum]
MPATVETTPCLPGLSPVAGKPVLACFDGEMLSSDGGLLALLRVPVDCEHRFRLIVNA